MLVIDWLNESLGQVFKVKRVLAHERTAFQDVLICDVDFFGKTLFLDDQLQSTQIDQELYHSALTEPMLTVFKPSNILIIGGGEGATANHALRHSDAVTMVDIDDRLVQLCRRYLPEFHGGVFSDKRLKTVFTDGASYVAHSGDTFDAIIVDGTDPSDRGPGATLYSQVFYRDCWQRLSSRGVFVTQAGSSYYRRKEFNSVKSRISKVFRDTAAYHVWIPSYGSTWGFIVARKTPIPRTLLRRSVSATGSTMT
ncbi:MAG: hypothetical protein M1357_00420 [Candidatus Marsarchaeota archaeon]|nr:hypothetical protein [Candidatus Marsarchaeota archaeon]